MDDIVNFSHALSDQTRVRLVHLLKNEALCVCELADILQMPQSSVSSHIQVIRKADLLVSERCEKWIYYRMDTRYLRLLKTIGEFFELPGDPVLATDARNARARIAQRAQSCCPGPRSLSTKNKTRPQSREKTRC